MFYIPTATGTTKNESSSASDWPPALSSYFDPKPMDFRPTDAVGVLRVRRAINQSSGKFAALRPIVNRNAFLVGCLDYTEHSTIEHLIIGFGGRYGTTTKVSGLMHAVGNANSVAPTGAMLTAIENNLRSDFKTEVIIFHNHPRNWFNILFDNAPIASARTEQSC